MYSVYSVCMDANRKKTKEELDFGKNVTATQTEFFKTVNIKMK